VHETKYPIEIFVQISKAEQMNRR